MNSSDMFTADDPASDRQRYNISDVRTVFQLEENVELPVEEGVIYETSLSDGTVVLPTGTKILSSAGQKILPISLSETGDHHVLHIDEASGKILHDSTSSPSTGNNQILHIAGNDGKILQVLPIEIDDGVQSEVLQIQSEGVFATGPSTLSDNPPGHIHAESGDQLHSTATLHGQVVSNHIHLRGSTATGHLQLRGTADEHLPAAVTAVTHPSSPAAVTVRRHDFSPAESIHSELPASVAVHTTADMAGSALTVHNELHHHHPVVAVQEDVSSRTVTIHEGTGFTIESDLTQSVDIPGNLKPGLVSMPSQMDTSLDIQVDLQAALARQQGSQVRTKVIQLRDAMEVQQLEVQSANIYKPIKIANSSFVDDGFSATNQIQSAKFVNNLEEKERGRNKDGSLDRQGEQDDGEQVGSNELGGVGGGMSLDDFVEIYTIIKCKLCVFTCAAKDELYCHVRESHADMLKPDLAPESRTSQVTENRQMSEYNLEGTPTTTTSTEVIIDEVNPSGRRNVATYFQFYLVKEQRQVFICTRCSVCMPTENSMKAHVKLGSCEDHKCKNCGLRLTSLADYNKHTAKCKIAIFKVKGRSDQGGVNLEVAHPDEEIDDPVGDGDGHDDDVQDVVQVEVCRPLHSPFHIETLPWNENEAEAQMGMEQEGMEGSGEQIVKGRGGEEILKKREGFDIAKERLGEEVVKEKGGEEDKKLQKLMMNRTELEVDGDKRIWVCSVKTCSAIFKDTETMDLHYSCHQGDNLHQLACPFCAITYTRWPDLSQHLYTSHNKDYNLYECLQCRQYKTSSVSSLEKHCLTHSNLRLFQCNLCHKGFNQKVQLRNHYVMHLKKHGREIPNWASARECDICHKVLADSKILKKHVQAVHSKLKPYICKICGYKCARNFNLKLHARQHTGSKPFECKECDYKTGDTSALKRHMRMHTNERPFKCDMCSFSSTQAGNLKRHKLSKHKNGKTKVKKAPIQRKKLITLKAAKTKLTSEQFNLSQGIAIGKGKEMPLNVLHEKGKEISMHILEEKGKEMPLHVIEEQRKDLPLHMLEEKGKEIHSIHTFDTLLALATEEN